MRTSLSFVSLLATALVHAAYSNQISQYTPQAMLSLPRRGTAIPNKDGTLALYTVATYSFEERQYANELRVLQLQNGTSRLFSNSSAISNANWLGDGDKIIWLESGDDGSTIFFVGDVSAPETKPTSVGSVPGPITNLKLVNISNGTLGLAFTGQVSSDGSLYNPNLATTPYTSGRTYDALLVRHWDVYLTPERNSIWYTSLSKGLNAYYTLSTPVNALKGSGLESPVPPFGATNSFDIGSQGLAFVAKDPTLNQANTTKSDVYYIPLTTFQETAPKIHLISTPGLQGASNSPVFSPSGSSLAFLRMKDISYESDKNRVLVVPNVSSLNSTATEFYNSADGNGSWDSSPSLLFYSQDGATLYAVAEDLARDKLFSFPSDPTQATDLPSTIVGQGTTLDVRHQGANKILVSVTGFFDNSVFFSIDPHVLANSNGSSGVAVASSNLNSLSAYGLSLTKISEFYYQGDGDYLIHAWIIRPSFFVEGQTYPLLFYIHGGPQSATNDEWSTQWNLGVFAEQGYIVVAFNPTGSTGFGQRFTDSVQNQWGGRPYNDLVKGWEYIEANLTYIDTDRAVAVGAGFGGYMVNWIQGQALGRVFKALFTDNGCFNTVALYSTDELWFIQHDFNGTLWNNYENYERWNPAAKTSAWNTSHLIAHNDLNYRLPIAEGLSAFNVLQDKGIKSKFLNFPDEDAWVINPENSLIWYETVLNFLNEQVGLPAYSSSEDEAYKATLMN